ncbi:MAG: YggT family protein [Acidimicrobiales bacterium]
MSNVIVLLLNILVVLLFARAILSWIRIGPDSPFRPVVDVIHRITEPILAPIRGILPAMGGFDLSPLLLIIAIRLVQTAL